MFQIILLVYYKLLSISLLVTFLWTFQSACHFNHFLYQQMFRPFQSSSHTSIHPFCLLEFCIYGYNKLQEVFFYTKYTITNSLPITILLNDFLLTAYGTDFILYNLIWVFKWVPCQAAEQNDCRLPSGILFWIWYGFNLYGF